MKQGTRIKELRTRKGLTQQELADACGLTLRTVQRIENDEVKPSFHSLRLLEQALGSPLQEEPATPGRPGKVEVKLIITNMDQLAKDVKTLYRNNWKTLTVIALIIFGLANYRDIKKGFSDALDNSSVEISTINCGSERECDIQVVKKDGNGKLAWKKIIGGTSYDKAGSVIRTGDGGYLVVGSTSSFGNGNYDVLLTKLDKNGNTVWQNNYGGFLNDYGYKISAVDTDGNFEIEGTQQVCTTPNVSDQCRDEIWTFTVDSRGKKRS